jgi:microcystin-dependent protein
MSDFVVGDTISNFSGIINFVPGDIVMLNSSASIPDGWLACNGQLINVSSYPELYDAIGTFYGFSGSPATQFRIPDLNNTLDSFYKFPTGTVGNATSYTTPTYAAHTHSSYSASLQAKNEDFISAHNHAYSQTGVAGNQNHNHGQATGDANAGWAGISGDRANYSSTGTAGGISDSNHTHPYQNRYNSGTSNGTHSHTVTATAGSSAASGGHTHTVTETISFTGSPQDLPNSYRLYFIIKS